MTKKLSKCEQIRQYLYSGHYLTQWECTMKFHFLRLGALIFKMRRQGVDIITEMLPTDDGMGHYARYHISEAWLKENIEKFGEK